MGKNALIRNNLLSYCESESPKLQNSTYRDSKIGTLMRYFDSLPQHGFIDYIPTYIRAHFNNLPIADKNKNLKLWSYRLGAYVQIWLLDAQYNLQSDIADSLRSAADSLKRSFLSQRMPEREIANCLCKAYLLMLYQYLFSIQTEPDLVKQIHNFLSEISFINPQQLEYLSQLQLLKNYKLLLKEESHLQFWQQYVDPGLFTTGGKEIIFSNGNKYRVPTGVHSLMNTADHFNGSYDQLKVLINQARQKRVDALGGISRNDLTQKFYTLNEDELEYRKIKFL